MLTLKMSRDGGMATKTLDSARVCVMRCGVRRGPVLPDQGEPDGWTDGWSASKC